MRQFYINIEKNPQKCKKCEMTHFWATKSLKGGHFFLIKGEFFEDFDENMHKFLGQFLSKSPFCPTSETPSGRIQCNVWFRLSNRGNRNIYHILYTEWICCVTSIFIQKKKKKKIVSHAYKKWSKNKRGMQVKSENWYVYIPHAQVHVPC